MNIHRFSVLAGLLLPVAFLCSSAPAQNTGDYRSFQSGTWSDVNSWERFDGSLWQNPAPAPPATADGAVTILGGDTITVTATDSVDQLTIDAGGVLIVITGTELNVEDGSGSDLTLNGVLINAGAVTLDAGADIAVGDGGLYRHDQNGGTIPTATWGTGSTCEVTGAVGNAPGNANQNFHHFTWNCPGQTSNLNLAWDNITIGGDVRVVSSGSGSNRFQFTSSTYSGTTITINGDLIVTGGAVASNGSGGAATYTIEMMGNINVTAGNLGVSRGSGGNATWRLHGDFSVSNATIQSSNPLSRFVFVRPDTQRVAFENVTSSGTYHYEVDTTTIVLITDGADTVDIVVPDSLICRGEVLATGVLAFANGAVYVHARNGGSIPVARWQTGSSCEVTGYLSGSKPGNLNQDFADFVWDCPGQSANVDWGWFGNTVSGNLLIRSTGSARAYLTSPSAGTPNTITLNGDITLEAGQFSSNGSGSVADISVVTMGNVIVNGGNFSVSRGSQGSGTGSVTWFLHGDMTMSNATTQNSNPTEGQAKFVFMKQGTQNLLLSSMTFGGGGLPIVVDAVSTLNLDTSVVAGSGMFLTLPGASLETAHPDGFEGNLQMTGTLTLDQGANYRFNGAVPQTSGFLMPDSVTVLAFDNAAGVVFVDTLSCAGLQVTTGSTVSIADTARLTVASGSILGTVINTGTMSGAPALTFGTGSVYRHNRDGGDIPTATWGSGSLCEITGATGNAPGNANQDFHDFTWNCPGQTSNLNLAWSGNTIGGDLTVLNSALSQFRLTNNTAHLAPITIAGDVLLSSGTLTATGSSTAATYTVNVLGNLTATGGTLAASRGSGGVATWNLHGNCSVSDAELRTSNPDSRFVFTGTAPQVFSLNNVSYTSTVNVDVDTGAIVSMDTSSFGGTGTFTVRSGGTLLSGHPNGLDGNLTSSAVVLSTEGNYGFTGSTAQGTGVLLPATVNKLIIGNAAGVALGSSVIVSDTLHCVAGVLALGANNVTAAAVAGGSSTSYLATDGIGTLTLPGVGASQTLFPVGTTSAYAPVWIANSGTPDGYSVSVAPDAGTSVARVNLLWNITESTPGGSTVTLQLGWMASHENAAFAANRAGNAKIFDLTDTSEAGSGDYGTQFTNQPYFVFRGGFTALSPFAVGSFSGGPTAVGTADEVPTVFRLEQNYPNPFNPTTVIRYDIPRATHVSISLYDALGRVVTELVDGDHVPGFYTVEWDARGFASGVYFYRIVAGDFTEVRNMMLLR